MPGSRDVAFGAMAICAATAILLEHPLLATFGILVFAATLGAGAARDWRLRVSGAAGSTPPSARDARVVSMWVWASGATLVALSILVRVLLNAG